MVLDARVTVPVGYEREHEQRESNVSMFTNNHKYKHFSFGYGLSYINYDWTLHKEGYFDAQNNINYLNEEVVKKHSAFGFSFPAYYKIGRKLFVGLIYNPTFYTPSLPNKFTYEHVITIDLKFKIRIKK